MRDGCGVLALQGDFAAHSAVLARLGASPVAVRRRSDLAGIGALVLPGGESTTMLRLMEPDDLLQGVADLVATGVPVLGTCAGVILLGTTIRPAQPSLGLLDIEVERNAWGRQISSTVAPVELATQLGEPRTTPGVFIRAPRIRATGPGVEILGRRAGEPVLVRQGRVLGATYHPELGTDDRVHRLLLSMMASAHE